MQNSIADRDSFFLKFENYFPEVALVDIRKSLAEFNETQFEDVYNYPFKNPLVMILAAFPLGIFGVDRFLLGDIGLGIVKMLTLGQFLIGFTIDCFTVEKRTRDYNFDQFLKFKIKSVLY